MDAKKKRRLKAAGFETGTVQEFLGLTDDETQLIAIKVTLALKLKQNRKRKLLTQKDLAEIMGSDQSRIARVEQGDGTLDLIVRALLKTGATPKQIGRAVAGAVVEPVGQVPVVKRPISHRTKKRSVGIVSSRAKPAKQVRGVTGKKSA